MILLNNKKGGIADTHNLEESPGNYAEWKKVSQKGTYYMISFF